MIYRIKQTKTHFIVNMFYRIQFKYEKLMCFDLRVQLTFHYMLTNIGIRKSHNLLQKWEF